MSVFFLLATSFVNSFDDNDDDYGKAKIILLIITEKLLVFVFFNY